MPSLPPKILHALRELVASLPDDVPSVNATRCDRLVSFIDAALAPKRSVRLARKRRETKKQTRREKVAAIRAAVMARAGGFCECGCGHEVRADSLLFAPHMDHFFGGSGRRKETESVETCWLLAVRCHEQKHAGFPTAAHWLEKFVTHCERHGYRDAAEIARARLESLEIQNQMQHPKGTP